MSKDIELVNGDKPTPQVAGIHIDFDVNTQTVTLTFDQTQFRTWDFVLAVLDMAKRQAEMMRQHALMNAAMQQQAQAQQAGQILRNLRH